jgi:hypothetical protein
MNITDYLNQIDDLLDAASQDPDIDLTALADAFADVGRRCIDASVELVNVVQA